LTDLTPKGAKDLGLVSFTTNLFSQVKHL
jgi:hypothetical protein